MPAATLDALDASSYKGPYFARPRAHTRKRPIWGDASNASNVQRFRGSGLCTALAAVARVIGVVPAVEPRAALASRTRLRRWPCVRPPLSWPVPSSRVTSRHLGSGEGGDAGAHVELVATVRIDVLPDQRRESVVITRGKSIGPVRPVCPEPAGA